MGVGGCSTPDLSVALSVDLLNDSSVHECMFCHDIIKRVLKMPFLTSTHPIKIWSSYKKSLLSVNSHICQ